MTRLAKLRSEKDGERETSRKSSFHVFMHYICVYMASMIQFSGSHKHTQNIHLLVSRMQCTYSLIVYIYYLVSLFHQIQIQKKKEKKCDMMRTRIMHSAFIFITLNDFACTNIVLFSEKKRLFFMFWDVCGYPVYKSSHPLLSLLLALGACTSF